MSGSNMAHNSSDGPRMARGAPGHQRHASWPAHGARSARGSPAARTLAAQSPMWPHVHEHVPIGTVATSGHVHQMHPSAPGVPQGTCWPGWGALMARGALQVAAFNLVTNSRTANHGSVARQLFPTLPRRQTAKN